jgi:hypothetical protein
MDEPSGKERQKQQRLQELNAVSEHFRSEVLTRRNLEAFEMKAMEKLMDYADYLGIDYDHNVDTSFRIQAQENIRQLFVRSAVPRPPVPSNINPDPYNSLQFLIGSAEVIKPLKREASETYTGSIRYSMQILGIISTDTTILDSSVHNMQMVLQREYKHFGKDSLLIWEVLLDHEGALPASPGGINERTNNKK